MTRHSVTSTNQREVVSGILRGVESEGGRDGGREKIRPLGDVALETIVKKSGVPEWADRQIDRQTDGQTDRQRKML